MAPHGQKRSADSEPGTSKNAKVSEDINTTALAATDSAAISSTSGDITNMSASGMDSSVTGTNSSGSPGGNDASPVTGGQQVVIPRNHFYKATSPFIFHKSFRVSTFANAWKPLRFEIGSDWGNNTWLCSPLTEIPWNRVCFYMTHGEFVSLPPNLQIKKVCCKVVQLNPRIAFETNASTSALATFNQNRDGIVAIGIESNPHVFGQNMIYGYDASRPMVPNDLTAVGQAHYRDISDHLWGNPLTTTDLPAGLTRQPLNLINKFTFKTDQFGPTTSVAEGRNHSNYSEHFDQYDMNQFVRKEIVNICHYPVNSYLTRPLTTHWPNLATDVQGTTPLNALINFPLRQSQNNGQRLGVNNDTWTNDRVIESNRVNYNITTTSGNIDNNDENRQTIESSYWNNDLMSDLNTTFNRYYDLIDQGEWLRKWGIAQPHMGQYQKSLHIGMQPTPVLSTSTSQVIADDFLDTQVFYDVDVEMECEMKLGTNFSYCDGPNTIVNDLQISADLARRHRNNTGLSNSDPTYAAYYHSLGGLYRNGVTNAQYTK